MARRAASRLVSAGRALITGISGQDGSYLAELLLEQGYEVVGMARRPGRIDEEPGALAGVHDRIRVVPGDLLEPATLYRAVAEVQPTELYHLAAPTFVPASWGDPTETVQAIAGGTAALLAGSLALGDGAPRVWVATSSEIFGDAGESPQHERSPMRPRTPYGVAKLAAHGLVGAMRAGQGLFACSGITYNHESPRRPERFLPRKVTSGVAAIRLGLQDELVLGDLGAVRDWTHAADIVRAAWLALQADEPGDVVLASGVARTVGELVAVAFAHVGLDPERHVCVDPSLVRDPEPTPPVGDPSRAHTVLGWQPAHSFEEMIAEMVDADLVRLRSERSLD